MSFIENFADNLRTNIIERNSRSESKKYNRHIKHFKYALIYPFLDTNGTKSILFGFSNNNTVYVSSDENNVSAFKLVEYSHEMFSLNVEIDFNETQVLDTSTFKSIEIPKIEWSELINAPKLNDGDFDILKESFLEFHNLEDLEFDYESNQIHFDWNSYFNSNNKPSDLELRIVWEDTDSSEKYGDITTTVFWKQKFIGVVNTSGKWLDTHSAYTVNIDEWRDLMNCIKVQSKYVSSNKPLLGVEVVDMNSTEPDNITCIPGYSERQFT